jgi:biopolymer transport protein ExbB/TolQ
MDLSFLNTALHTVSESIMYPVIALLLLGAVYAIFSIGSLLVEFFVERRHFKASLPALQHGIDAAEVSEVPQVIRESGLLLTQKRALLTLFDNRDLPEEARWALAKKILFTEEQATRNKVVRNETIAKIAPMFGLMGTLIPLGPGVVALGKGEVETLSASLLVAFDTTVVGLIVGAVCMVVARIRRSWYAEYNEALEAAVTTMLEKIDALEKAHGGRLTVDHKEVNEQVRTAGTRSRQSRRAQTVSAEA